jgi:putative Ca2+/H+ antiporter (TMEM165/GDT1 family)
MIARIVTIAVAVMLGLVLSEWLPGEVFAMFCGVAWVVVGCWR